MKRRQLIKLSAGAVVPVFPRLHESKPAGECACDWLEELALAEIERPDRIDHIARYPDDRQIIIHGSGTPPYPLLDLAHERVTERCHVDYRETPAGFAINLHL